MDFLPEICNGTISHSGSTLVTGGLGDIGQLVGTWMAARSTRGHVWLLGRTGRLMGSHAVDRHADQCCIHMVSGNTAVFSDTAGINQLMVDAAAPAMTCALHAAAVLADATLARQSAAGLRLVMAPKYSGALCVLRASWAVPLRELVHFSSLTAILGNEGQANYAAANGILDDVSQETVHSGLRSSTILWGPWALGLALKDSNTLHRMLKGGLGVISSKNFACAPSVNNQKWIRQWHALHLPHAGTEGLRLLCTVLNTPAISSCVAASVQWPTLLSGLSTIPPFFACVSPTNIQFSNNTHTAPYTPVHHNEAAPLDHNDTRLNLHIVSIVKDAVRGLLNCDVEDDTPLMEAGLDSLGKLCSAKAVVLRDPA